MAKCPFVKTLKLLGRGSRLRGPGLCVGSQFLGPTEFSPGYYITCIGKKGSLDAVYDDFSAGEFQRSLPFDGFIEGIAVHEDKMYMLVSQPSYKVYVTESTPKNVITSWRHSDSPCDGYNKLAVIADMVIVPQKSKKQLTVYSLVGKLIKHISCPPDGTWTSVAICAADNESVVVSSTNTSTVFRVNIGTGEVTWTCTDVILPGGVTCYGEDYILVSRLSSNRTEIFILGSKTGVYLGKVTESVCRGRSTVPDLAMAGNTLVVPRLDEEAVFCYELIKKE